MARPSRRIQAQAGLAGPSTAGSGQPGDLGGAAVVNFWAGKLCFLSLNVVFFFVLFLVVSCAVCCANFCDQIIREFVHFLCFFVDEVVMFVVLIFVTKSSGKLCTFCAFFVDEVVVGAKYKIN